MSGILQLKDVFYTYGDGTQALKGINLSVPKNSKTVLLGENGAGKSTLLFHLNALFIASKGEVTFKGKKITEENEEWVRTQVGLVFQDPDDQIFASSVFEDIAFGPLNLGLGAEEVNAKVNAAMAKVMISHLQNKAPHHLSYGQKKRVAIAGVLAMEPEVIILDEPAAYLDPAGQDSLVDILDELHGEGKTIIVATHDINMAAEWANNVIILKDGKTLKQGGPEILVDKQVINEANLHLPIVAKLYEKIFPNREILPYNINQAFKLFKEDDSNAGF